MVMISGLNHTRSMNGAEFEVITVPATNQFTVQHTVSLALGDTARSRHQRHGEEPGCARQAQNSARRQYIHAGPPERQ